MNHDLFNTVTNAWVTRLMMMHCVRSGSRWIGIHGAHKTNSIHYRGKIVFFSRKILPFLLQSIYKHIRRWLSCGFPWYVIFVPCDKRIFKTYAFCKESLHNHFYRQRHLQKMTIVVCHNEYDGENDYDNEGRILQFTMLLVYHHDIRLWIKVALIGDLAKDSSNSIVLAMELLQSRAIYWYVIIY